MMLREPTRDTDHPTESNVPSRHVAMFVWTAKPFKIESVVPAGSPHFTKELFEDALDKASRPVKGKYADVPYSSEDLIRDKREEAELEDR